MFYLINVDMSNDRNISIKLHKGYFTTETRHSQFASGSGSLCFPVCWRLADGVPAPKRSLSSDLGDYRSTSITPLLSMVFEKIVVEK